MVVHCLTNYCLNCLNVRILKDFKGNSPNYDVAIFIVRLHHFICDSKAITVLVF